MLHGPALDFNGDVKCFLLLYWDNGKENGNYYNIIGFILGLYWDNGDVKCLWTETAQMGISENFVESAQSKVETMGP